MVAKKTNLCLSADVTSTSTLLRLADACGPYICILKTHADIIDDFGPRTIKGLRELSRQHKFLIFEDRKFGDIPATVKLQYSEGLCKIATWAHIVNAHAFPGPTVIKALREAADQVLGAEGRGIVSTEVWVGTPAESEAEDEIVASSPEEEKIAAMKAQVKAANARKDSIIANTTIFQTVEVSGPQHTSQSQSHSAEVLESQSTNDELLQSIGEPPIARSVLMFAQMSSEGNLMDEKYTQHSVSIARNNKDFVIGFIAQRSLNQGSASDDMLTLTPGVKLPPSGKQGDRVEGDGLGQQYRTPAEVIGKDGCDVVIVGRGITAAKDRAKEAQRYRDEAWKAYEARLKS